MTVRKDLPYAKPDGIYVRVSAKAATVPEADALMEPTEKRLNEILAKHTGQKIETIEKDTDRDNFLSATQAVSYGLVDKVLSSRTDATV